ncbi:TIGR00153 family protein [Candidiatus Paracoxiella cheracis]|uniref:TIGR00153 family protein n=1 Tax=Candidiatus Paracoxiella cheracis TaxID=3405120 RepID=UPI003BF529A3
MLRQTAILDMFGRSPIRPLQQHMEKAHACVELLIPFSQAVLKEDWEEAARLQQEISELEHAADDLKKDLRLHLPKGLFLPVPRGDLLELLKKQELLANTAKDIAGIMLGRRMQIPPSLTELFSAFLKRSVDASAQAKKAISELDELLESGFRGKEVTVVDHMIKELNRIEYDTDQIQIQIRQALFDIEKSLAAVDVMFLYKIFEWIGFVADCAQQTGSRLQMLLAN